MRTRTRSRSTSREDVRRGIEAGVLESQTGKKTFTFLATRLWYA